MFDREYLLNREKTTSQASTSDRMNHSVDLLKAVVSSFYAVIFSIVKSGSVYNDSCRIRVHSGSLTRFSFSVQLAPIRREKQTQIMVLLGTNVDAAAPAPCELKLESGRFIRYVAPKDANHRKDLCCRTTFDEVRMPRRKMSAGHDALDQMVCWEGVNSMCRVLDSIIEGDKETDFFESKNVLEIGFATGILSCMHTKMVPMKSLYTVHRNPLLICIVYQRFAEMPSLSTSANFPVVT
ncbi:hypothetical protein KIN20_034196 [Parelaphostrongylus tenuis]|uniref:Uncharacterized protein n=1 Tax=Parelaphostrongylus tenuis TaxID=148309 RepID=A0AAD5RBY2_PARTN|nr:hypothetical protein KIN20_034196 [Parelaphostrongylus tenuis]